MILGYVCALFSEKNNKKNRVWFWNYRFNTGVIFVISIPTNKVGWDEETHFKRAYQMSIYPGGEKFLQRYLDSLRRIHYTTILIFNHNHMKKSKI